MTPADEGIWWAKFDDEIRKLRPVKPDVLRAAGPDGWNFFWLAGEEYRHPECLPWIEVVWTEHCRWCGSRNIVPYDRNEGEERCLDCEHVWHLYV